MMDRAPCQCLLLFMVLLFVPNYLHARDEAKLKRMEEVSHEMAKERNKEIHFYGQAIDFDGGPVVDAKVNMRIRVFGARSPQKSFEEFNVSTDSAGRFSVVGFGELITLGDISKEGYVYDFKYNHERSQWASKIDPRNILGLEPDKPMVFRVRKKAQSAFVFSGGWTFALRDGGSELLDLYRRQWAVPDRLTTHKMTYPDWHADVRLSVEEDGEKFRLILETLDSDSGFVIDTPEFVEEMTEAPEQGYRSKLVIPIAKKSGGRLFAYVKSAGGLFYSKFFVSYSNSEGRDYVELRSGYWTNMVGGRGLELSDELYVQYRSDVREGRREEALRGQLLSGRTVAPILEASQ